MNLTNVLSWSTSFTSLSLHHHRAQSPSHHQSTLELKNPNPGRILTASAASSARPWPSNGYSRGSNAVSTREENDSRYRNTGGFKENSRRDDGSSRPNEGRNGYRNSEVSSRNEFGRSEPSKGHSGRFDGNRAGDVRNGYRNSEGSGRYNKSGSSEGSREDSGRYSGGGSDARNGSRNSEAWKENSGRFRNGGQAERRYGRKGSSGGGGYGRGGKNTQTKTMHHAAYTMRDEQGDMVVVWGVEDEDTQIPTASDLNWKKTKVALPGELSDETWAKAMSRDGSTGSYSVRGVEQRGKTQIDDDEYEDDSEDDFQDDTIFDEDDSDSDFDEPIERPKVSISRAPRVKVFGRDLWGKSQQKVSTPEVVSNDEDTVGPFMNSQAVLTSTALATVDMLERHPVSEVDQNTETLVGNASPSNIGDEQEFLAFRSTAEGVRTGPTADEIVVNKHDKQAFRNSAEDARSVAAKANNPVAEVAHKFRELGNKFPERSAAAKVDKSLPRLSAAKADDNHIKKRKETPTEDENRGLENEDDFAGERHQPAKSSFNPYIIDISEERGSGSQTSQYEGVRKSDLLDRLRSQVISKSKVSTSQDRVKQVVNNETPSSTVSGKEAVEAPIRSIEDSKRPPLRDLTDRDNYDASIVNEFFSLKSFSDMGATSDMITALSYLNVKRPSNIQAMAFKPVLEGKSCIIAEQTGSGKTLAYVAPIVQRLNADEAQTLGKSLSKKPRVLVLVPTGELAAQVLGAFRAISKGGVPCRSIALTGGFKLKTQVESLQAGADVVVATPGRLLQHLEAGNIHFEDLHSVVFDEVDILFDDEDFSRALDTINKAASIKAQYIHVTATLPVDIHDDLLERYPDCLSLMGPNLHRTAPGLQEVLVDCSGGDADEKTPESAFINKKMALLQLVDEKPVAKTIVFCNKMETCRKVENILSRHDRSGKKIMVLPYHAALSQEARLESLEIFMKSQPKERLFLVCTDRASRGIDSLDVEHVVLFDFPRDPSEYVRRIGRTARGAGGTGKVFAFVVGRQVGHARRIMARNDKGEPVHDVPGSRYYYTN